MNSQDTFNHRLQSLLDLADKRLVCQGRQVGLEKESLRCKSSGVLSQIPHPPALGSALTHPHITTDYSEALLEMVSPPLPDVVSAMAFLNDIHTAVFAGLPEGEMLWPASMPCIVRDESDIPLAYYGTSNMGQMKTIYRRGLGYRYGRAMQTISGVHFNYSFGDALWQALQQVEGDGEDLQTFRSRRYMDALRNFLRVGWMVPYLFGTSPAVCRRFVSHNADLEAWDESTLYGRYATSLRMGNIGYQNNEEAKIGVKASYNSLAEYVASLAAAVTTPVKRYQEIGVDVAGEYRQLNACILQIENEYYSTVRPKQPAQRGEVPLVALRDRGVEYVELRSLDVGIFDPIGVSEDELHWLEALLYYCLLDESPPIESNDWQEIDGNEIKVAHQGRKPQLELMHKGSPRALKDWGLAVCDAMAGVCQLLDEATQSKTYTTTLAQQVEKLQDPQQCPSMRVLDAMHESGASFVAFSERQARHYKDFFAAQTLSGEMDSRFADLAKQSIAEQAALEAQDDGSLKDYIAAYFAQVDS